MNKLDVDEVELVLPVPSVKSSTTELFNGFSIELPERLSIRLSKELSKGLSETAANIYKMIYGNYLSFRDAHLKGEGRMFRINDTFSTSDHMDAGVAFLMNMMSLKNYGAYFNWLCEGSATGIRSIDNVQLTIDNSWYTLDGRRLSSKPSQKGIYLNHGRKVIIK